MKNLLFALVFFMSGCASLPEHSESFMPTVREKSIEALVLRGTAGIALDKKDISEIVAGIRTVHENKERNIPDQWKTSKGLEISVVHTGFSEVSEGVFTMTASVAVDGREIFPPTTLVFRNGLWTVLEKTEPVRLAAPVPQMASEPAAVAVAPR